MLKTKRIVNLKLAAALGLSLVISAGCTSGKSVGEISEPELDRIMSNAGFDGERAAAERCLSSERYNDVDIIDKQHLLFRGTGNRLWLNRLRTKCMGLRHNDTLRFDLTGSRLCNLDSVSAISRGFIGFQSTSAKCSLGEFQPVSAEQVEMLKRATKGN